MNKLIIAAAGSGKTTSIINQAIQIKDENVLITTFTDANENEIRKKFIEINGFVPSNVTIQTWFSFLIQHGVKPYQSAIYECEIQGLKFVSEKSGKKGWFRGKTYYFGEKDLPQYYFDSAMRIYSDKLSKFAYRENEITNGQIIKRLARIYSYIFIDEVQDLAGYDLEIVKLLIESEINTIMVGDPRQVTYLTHDEQKNKKYESGGIEDYILDNCSCCEVVVDKVTLNKTYRNNKEICSLANSIYPELDACDYEEGKETNHDGVYFVNPNDVDFYLETYLPIQMRDTKRTSVNQNYPFINFGESKGLTFDRVMIYPTKPMLDWLLDHSKTLKPQSRARLYVAITRAKHSVAIVFNNTKNIDIEGIKQFVRNE